MKHLYILGNGFDLAHGLKTSYRDFVLWYLSSKLNCIVHEATSTQVNDGLTKIDKDFGLFLIHTTPELTDVNEFDLIVASIKQEYNHRIDVYYSPLFESIMNHEGWADIEKLYFELLLDVHFKTNRFSFSTKNIFPYTLTGLNSTLISLKLQFMSYLNDRVSPEISIKPIIKSIEHCLLYDRLIGNTYELVKEDKLFLNFNYTNTLDKYSTSPFGKEERINIHGSISNPKNPIIFGYGDEMHKDFKAIEDEDNNDYLENMKSFGYYQTDNYKKILNFIESDEYYVHVIGHSLGLSDRLLLNTIFEHENCKTIEIHYHRFEDGDNYTELTMNMSRHFKDKAAMRKKVIDRVESRPMD